jgi:lysine 6-dehydrogenase
MKVIIFGAAGAMASVVMRDLLESVPEVSITAADTRPMSTGDPRLKFVIADVRDEPKTAELIRGNDVVINCVNYYWNLPVMRAALQAKTPYADLGGLYHGTLQQFALHDEFVSAGVPALLGMGSTPGITNVMAGAIASQMDRVEEMHVRVASMDESASGPLPVPYALDTILDEFALEPMVFQDGKAFAAPPMSGSESIQFPSPIGPAEAVYTLHSEVAMFPRSFPSIRNASFKIAFPKDFMQKMKFLVELGFASREPLIGDVSPRQMLSAIVSRQPIVPGEPRDCDVLRVLVHGWKAGKKSTGIGESIIFPHPRWKIAAGSLDTGVPLSIAAQMLTQKIIRTPGVLCPEVSVPPELFFRELEKRNISVSLRSSSDS